MLMAPEHCGSNCKLDSAGARQVVRKVGISPLAALGLNVLRDRGNQHENTLRLVRE